MLNAIPKYVGAVLVMTAVVFGQDTKPAPGSESAPAPGQDAAVELPADAMNKAMALQGQQEYVEAAELFMMITEAQPDNGPAWFNLGYSLHMAGELDLAISAHRKAATFERYTGNGLYNLGCAYALLGETDQAFEALLAAHEAGFNVNRNLDADSDLQSLRDDERFEQLREATASRGAMSAVEKARQYLQQNGPAMMQQAKAMAQQALALAQQKFQELQEITQDEEQMAELKARLHEMYARAHQAFLQWRQREFHDEDPGETYAANESDTDEGNEAEGDEAEVDVDGLVALADRHFQRTEFQDAARAYHAVVEVDPENGRAWFRMGYALHVEGEWEKALKAHKKAAQYDDFKGIALYNLACANSLLDNADAAFEALAQCKAVGFDRLGDMEADGDFDNIRDDSRFAEFVASLDDDDENEDGN